MQKYTVCYEIVSELLVSPLRTTNPGLAFCCVLHLQTEWNSNSTPQCTQQSSTSSSLEWCFYTRLAFPAGALQPFLRIPGVTRPSLAASILSTRVTSCDHFKAAVRGPIVRGILTRAARLPNCVPCPAAVHYGHLLGAGQGWRWAHRNGSGGYRVSKSGKLTPFLLPISLPRCNLLPILLSYPPSQPTSQAAKR